MDPVRERTCLQRQCTDHWVEEEAEHFESHMIKRDVEEEAEESKLLLWIGPLLRLLCIKKKKKKKMDFCCFRIFLLFFSLLVLFCRNLVVNCNVL